VKRQWVLWLAAVPILGAVLYTLQRADQAETITETAATALPRYIVRNAQLTRYDTDGSATLHAAASSIEYFDDDSSQAHDLQAELLSDGEATWHLSSPTGTMPPREHRILLGGPVLASGEWPDNGAPLSVDTTQVWVDPDSHQFETREPLTINGEARHGSAVGMRVNWDERRLQLLHNVKMTYVVAP
jgi:LPS export ABC transporter protein LptC